MKNKIPKGPYCYDENGICPFWGREEGNFDSGENGFIGTCSFLEITDEDCDLGLLWDQVKECEVNLDIEEDY